MSAFTRGLEVARVGGNLLRVQADLPWEIGYLGSGNIVTIPKGFLTDGPSVPWWGKPFMPMDHMQKPAVLHDFLLTQLEWEKDRVDNEFKIAMKACGVRQPYREIAYLAVHFNRSERIPFLPIPDS